MTSDCVCCAISPGSQFADMLLPRVIPVLLMTESGIVKTRCFKDARYVGDPINALRVFNEKQVDEIVLLDIEATAAGREPDYLRVRDLASECFMPMAYGGGISSAVQAERLFAGGVEKVIIGSQAVENPQLVTDISRIVGAQSVVVCIDVKRNWLGRRRVHVRNGTKDTGLEPVELAKRFEQLGAGEIILQSIDNDGRMEGFDVALIREVASSVSMPVVACGGAGKLSDFSGAIAAGASGVAGGSFFVFYGKHRAVLITYPSQAELKNLFTQLAG